MSARSLSLAAGLSVVTLAVGCGGGGGGRGGASFAGASGSGSTNAPIVSLTRDGKGYAFDTFYTNGAVGGSVTAVGTAPNTTAVLAGIAPLGQVNLIDGGSSVREAQFVFDVSALAMTTSGVYAATSNPNAPRAAQVWKRDDSTQPASWMLSLDGTQRETALAVYNGSLIAFSGEQNKGTGAVLMQTGSGWTEIATLTSAVPQVAAVNSGTIWVGSKAWDGIQGGAAKLHRSTNGPTKWEEIPVPGIVSPGQIGRVTGIATVQSGNAPGFVFVASQVTDRGDVKSGNLCFWDEKEGRLAVLAEFQDDAPSALAACEGTVYVGTAKGKLYYYAGAPTGGVQQIGGTTVQGQQQTPTTGLLEEPSVPSIVAVTTLASVNNLLWVGARGSKGAILYRRTGKSGAPVTPTPTPTPGAKPTVGTLTPATGAIGATVTINGTGFSTVAVENVVKFNGMTATVTAATATTITCTVPTGTTTGAVTVTVKGVAATGTPTFTVQAAVALKTFVADVKPILAAQNCAACHSSIASFRLGGTDMQDFTACTTQIGTPAETSKLLTKPTNENPHGGGLRFAKGGAEYNTVLQWIKDGAKFQ